jgi:hypothetical protein
MNIRNSSNSTRLLLAVVLLLGACSEDKNQAATQEIASKSELATSSKSPVSTKLKPAEPVSWCSFISPKDVAAALSGKLPLGAPKSLKTGCEYPVQFGIDGNNLTYRKLSRGNYDVHKGYENQSSVKFEYLEGVGQEAYILNNAQVSVLLNDNDAILVAAQVIAFGEELPINEEELKAGLITIARTVAAKL